MLRLALVPAWLLQKSPRVNLNLDQSQRLDDCATACASSFSLFGDSTANEQQITPSTLYILPRIPLFPFQDGRRETGIDASHICTLPTRAICFSVFFTYKLGLSSIRRHYQINGFSIMSTYFRDYCDPLILSSLFLSSPFLSSAFHTTVAFLRFHTNRNLKSSIALSAL